MRPRAPWLPLRSCDRWLCCFTAVNRAATLLLMLSVVSVLACGDDSSTEPNVRPTISITGPANGTVVLDGTSTTFTATASDSEDGNLSSSVSWTSSIDGAIGSGASLARTLSTGSHTVTASVSDSDRESASVSVTVVVHQPPTISITAPPDGGSIMEGSAVTFTGNAADPEDGDLAAAIVWTSDLAGSLGTGPSVTATLSPGTHTITATVADEHGAAAAAAITFTVTANAAPTISITAPADGATTLEGSALTFTGRATDAEDGDLTAGISWSSDRTGAIGTGGSVTATLESGVHVITASAGDSYGVSVSSQITVTVSSDMPPAVSISAPADNTSVVEGTSVTFTGAATDTEDGDLTATITWTSDLDLVLGTGGSITASLSVGTHTVTAAVTDSKGQSDTESVTVIVTADQAPSITITAPADGTSSTQGTPINFTAQASDPENGDLAANVTWSSSLDGQFGTGGSVTSSLSAGTHVVTAAVADAAGQSASATVSVTITGVTGNIGWQFCAPEIPVWVAMQDGNGPWTRVLSDNNRYSFNVSSGRGAIAYVIEPTGLGVPFVLSFFYGTASELNARANSVCGTKTLHTAVSYGGITGAQLLVSLGTSTTAGAAPLRHVLDGPLDLVATVRGTISGQPVRRVIIRRGVNAADGSTLPAFDFGTIEPVAAAEHNLTIVGLSSANTLVEVLSSFSTVTTQATALFMNPVNVGATHVWNAVPPVAQVTGDFHGLGVLARDVYTFGDLIEGRLAADFFSTLSDRTITLGPRIVAPTYSIVTATPYRRPRIVYNIQDEYSSAFTISYSQPGRVTLLQMSAAYLNGSGVFDVTIPDLSALHDFDVNWGLRPQTVNAQLAVEGWSAGGSGMLPLLQPGAFRRAALLRTTLP